MSAVPTAPAFSPLYQQIKALMTRELQAGVWKPEFEEHNKRLIARQDALAAAWTAFLETRPPEDPAQFGKAWLAARAAALKKAGFEPVFE